MLKLHLPALNLLSADGVSEESRAKIGDCNVVEVEYKTLFAGPVRDGSFGLRNGGVDLVEESKNLIFGDENRRLG